MNFTRWSARLPGTQRRIAAAQAGSLARQLSERARSARSGRSARAAKAPKTADYGERSGRGRHAEASLTADSTTDSTSGSSAGFSGTSEPGGDEGSTDSAGRPASTEAAESAEAAKTEAEEPVSRRRSVPTARAQHSEPPDPSLLPNHPTEASTSVSAPSSAADPPANSGALVTRSIDALTVHDLLGQVPALAAVVHGAEHRVAYVNDAYATVFGPRAPGAAARDVLPELVELGLLPLMDQVLRSGKPRTVKSRRVPGRSGTRDGFYTFTCTPITADGDSGVLIFAADVTDQVEAAERLRASERRQRAAAVTLQRSLLPQELEQPDDLCVAAVYQPGGTDAAVGGDWYDVITLGAGRTALVIGDVMGRGVRAAAVMGQLRTAVRAYARLDLPPHEVLQLLDGLAAEIDSSQIATCLYAVHDPNESVLHYASAGHLPILVRDSDGTVHRAAEATGPPLGTGGWVHNSASLPLVPGASAVLYTDGLVERREADIDEGVATLERAFSGAAGSPDIVCDRLLRALGITAEHDDDVAVLVLQLPERTGAEAELFHNAALDLLGGTEAAPRARAFASGVLSSWRFPTELHDLGVLAASELVANSLQHGTPPMRLRLRRTDRRLVVEVTDGDEHLPRRRRAEPVDEAGRGISIVATIASAWGARRTPEGGKSVWCEFALPSQSVN